MNFNLVSAAFENVNGASFVGIDTETTPVLKGGKKNPMQGNVRKIMTGASVMVFQNNKSNGYENMVNRRLAKEGKSVEFSVGPRQWGERIDGTPFVKHVKDGVTKYYLEVIFLKSGKSSYMLNGEQIQKSDITGMEEKEEGEQAGLDDKVIIRTFAMESITGIRINGVELKMR